MIGALIMVHSDDNGLVLPPRIAPRQVVVVPITNDEEIAMLATSINDKLKSAGVTSFIDDSDRSCGFKFAEHEVNGIPVRVEIGKRDLENGTITIARRDTRERLTVDKNCDIVKVVSDLMNAMQKDMFEAAKKRNDAKTYNATTIEEVKNIMEKQPGFVKAMWCGDQTCELKMKEIRGTKSRCIVEGEKPISEHCVCCGKPAKHMVVWGIQY
jgi:prolyl-tRNA synthetase